MSKYLVWLLLAIISGVVCAIIAKKRGRDAATWFGLGLIFGVFSIATLSFLQKRRLKGHGN